MQANIIVNAEYRSAIPETMSFPATQTRPARTIHRIMYNLEVENSAMSVAEELPDGSKPENWKAPAKKGQMVSLGLLVEPANVAQIVNGKAQAARGLWRVSVVFIRPLETAQEPVKGPSKA